MRKLCIAVFAFGLAILNGCGGGYSAPPTPPRVIPLTIVSGTPPAGTVGVAYGTGNGFTLSASGGTAPYVWTWAAATGSALPAGLALTNGVISGTPSLAGTFNVVVTVTDSPGSSGAAQIVSANYSITITSPASTLTITSGPPPAGQVSAAYGQAHRVQSPRGPVTVNFFQLTATGGTANLSWSWSADPGSTLPPGLTCCNPAFGGGIPFGRGFIVRGAIAGTPAAPGDYHVTITVTDNGSSGNGSADYTIHIAPPPPPSVNVSPSPAIGTLNSPYVGFTFTATNGFPPFTWSETGALPAGLVFHPDGSLTGTPTAAGTFPISVQVLDSVGQASSAQSFNIQVLAQGFVQTASLAAARAFHTANLLGNGRVLVSGGANDNGALASTELFDPTAKAFSPGGTMNHARLSHTATVLADGRVLVVGGFDGNGSLSSAELSDVNGAAFSLTGSLLVARMSHTATLLPSGKVLVTGGLDATGAPTATAELFDPGSGTFTATGAMTTSRAYHSATLLGNGKVLLTGGIDATGDTLASAEVFDPASGMFAATGNLVTSRSQHTATRLNNGTVLIAGGGSSGGAVNTAEIFDPASGTFLATGAMLTVRSEHTATLLANGQVLITGGIDFDLRALSSAELFDPVAGAFSRTADLTAFRSEHTATLLNTGQVLITGGLDANSTALATAELYH